MFQKASAAWPGIWTQGPGYGTLTRWLLRAGGLCLIPRVFNSLEWDGSHSPDRIVSVLGQSRGWPWELRLSGGPAWDKTVIFLACGDFHRSGF